MNNTFFDQINTKPFYTNFESYLQSIFFYLICGFCCCISNVLIITAIYKNIRLRNRFFIIISFLSGNRLIFSINIFSIGIQRLLKQINLLAYEQLRVVCKIFHLWYFIGITLELLLILVLVIDRIIAIGNGIRYRNMSIRQAAYICLACYVLSLLKIIPVFFRDSYLLDIIRCVNTFDAANATGGMISRSIDFGLLILIILLYIGLIIYVKLQIRNNEHEFQSQAVNHTLERQLALLPVLRNQILLHSGLSFLCTLLLFIGGIVKEETERLSLWGNNVLVVDLFVNTLALLLANEDIRLGVWRLLKRTDGDNQADDVSLRLVDGSH